MIRAATPLSDPAREIRELTLERNAAQRQSRLRLQALRKIVGLNFGVVGMGLDQAQHIASAVIEETDHEL